MVEVALYQDVTVREGIFYGSDLISEFAYNDISTGMWGYVHTYQHKGGKLTGQIVRPALDG